MSDVTTKNRPLIIVVALLAICIAGAVAFHFNKEKVTKFFWPEEPVVTTTDSISVDVPPTIDEIVSLRQDILENRRVDSIYLAMSDIELTAILMKIGTKSTIKEIVDAYQRLRPQLKDVLLGADIAEKIILEQQQRMQKLDSVPKVPLPAITPASPRLSLSISN